MIRFLSAAFLGILFSLQTFAGDWTSTYLKVRPSVPLVRSGGGVCSGALVGPDRILTAQHCVQYLHPITVLWYDGDKESKRQTAQILNWDKKADLALLKLDTSSTATPLKFAKPSDLKVGMEHGTIGHPFGARFGASEDNLVDDLLFSFSVGRVMKINGKKNFLSDMSLSPGNSGGSVFDKEGDILGVVSAKIMKDGAGQIGRIVHPEQVASFMAEPAKEIGWYEAGFSTNFIIKQYQFNFERENKKINGGVAAAELRLNFYDRLMVGFDRSFSASRDDIELKSFVIGYRQYFETAKLTPFYLGFGVRTITFNEDTLKEKKEDTFANLHAKVLLFEAEIGYNANFGGQSYLSLGMSF